VTDLRAIPRTIHQTWKHAQVPAGLLGLQRSWRLHNHGWDYRLWTDASARDFVAQHYPDFLPVYDGYDRSIKRVDAVRYLWMHRVGGVYADLDFECLRPLDELVAGGGVVLGLEPAEHVGEWVKQHGIRRIVGNAFLASAPGEPFWDYLRERLVEHRHVEDPLLATGPFFLTHALAEYSRAHEVTVYDSEILYPATKAECWRADGDSRRMRLPARAFAVHHFVGTWSRAGVTEALEAAPAPDAPDALPHVLVATPVKNARAHLPRYLDNLRRLDYPHERISLAFLESDSDDGSFAYLEGALERLRREHRRVELYRRDFGYRLVGPRWASESQLRRRSILARSRNQLVQQALRDEAWVLWLDADVVDYPPDVLRTLLATGKDIVVPHCLGQDGRTFDLNTFRFAEGAAARDWSAHVIDGLVQPPRGEGRLYLEDLREHAIVQVDGVGGTMLLIRAELHREGLVFPSFSYKQFIETEGLAMMARDMGHTCWGVPWLEIVHA
jgi:hypothetical protein